MNRVGIRVAGPVRREDPAAEGRGRARAEEPAARQGLQPPGDRRSTRSSRSCSRTPTGCGRWSPTPALLLDQALDDGKTVLLEGGQATLLDVDHGTYPFVTSSQRRPPAARAPAPASRRPAIDRVIGDRQGLHDPRRRGPVPDRAARRRRRAAARRSAPSSAPRPAGRAAAAGTTRSIARYAARVNGVTDFVLTKLDVLTGWEQIPVCVGLRRRRRAASTRCR